MSSKGSPRLPRRRPARPVLQGDLHPLRLAAPTQGQKRRRWQSAVFTGVAHVAVLAAVFLYRAVQLPEAKPVQPALQVSFVALPKPPGPSESQNAAGGAMTIALPTPPVASAPSIAIAATPNTSDLLSDSQVAGAARAGEGGGGGGCDLAQAVQRALRRDPLVREAVAGAGRLGRASMLWNGDWVRSGDQDGKGLAAVRQAVMWEVGFAPAACRSERMHGLILLSLADGSTRFAIGDGDWRWSDLLGLRSASVR